jgi:hypothetical protein
MFFFVFLKIFFRNVSKNKDNIGGSLIFLSGEKKI